MAGFVGRMREKMSSLKHMEIDPQLGLSLNLNYNHL